VNKDEEIKQLIKQQRMRVAGQPCGQTDVKLIRCELLSSYLRRVPAYVRLGSTPVAGHSDFSTSQLKCLTLADFTTAVTLPSRNDHYVIPESHRQTRRDKTVLSRLIGQCELGVS